MEATRNKMYKIYEENPKDPEILCISQKLDVLLNKYDQLRKNTKNST
ncbi:aspartyl-phosphate phosphatase Spo0E family protein [Virgibacillus siamensis]